MEIYEATVKLTVYYNGDYNAVNSSEFMAFSIEFFLYFLFATID